MMSRMFANAKVGAHGLAMVAAAIGFTVASAGSAHALPINTLVVNGGFETGDFTGWAGVGNTTFNGVQCPGPGATVQEGNCSGFFGPVGSTGGIQQSITTLANTLYEVTFFYLPDGGNPSSISASFAGVPLLNLVNPPASATYIGRSFIVAAPSTSSNLLFNFRDDPGFLFLDSVSVVQTPEPATLGLLGLGLAVMAARYRRKQARRS